jgi:hypothetical protein
VPKKNMHLQTGRQIWPSDDHDARQALKKHHVPRFPIIYSCYKIFLVRNATFIRFGYWRSPWHSQLDGEWIDGSVETSYHRFQRWTRVWQHPELATPAIYAARFYVPRHLNLAWTNDCNTNDELELVKRVSDYPPRINHQWMLIGVRCSGRRRLRTSCYGEAAIRSV